MSGPQTYDREVADIFTVQEDISREVATAVGIELTVAAMQRLRRRPTANLNAFELTNRNATVFVWRMPL